jgi:hypothetical protein
MSFKYPEEIAFVGEVTKYNNTQNSVKIADFRSNDEVQKDLARRFKSVNYRGRAYEYKNKRSEKKRNTLAVTLEELTKSVYAFRLGPDDMFGGTTKLFDASSTGLYTKVFENPELALSESGFNLIAGTYFACDFVRELWEAHRKALRLEGKALHPALERKGLVYYAIGELERLSYLKQNWELNQDLCKLSKPNNWLSEQDSSPRLALAKAFEIASKVLVQQYDTRKKIDPNFKHRNWFRDLETLRDIQTGLELATAFGFPPRIWL